MFLRFLAPLAFLTAVACAQDPATTRDSDWQTRFQQKYALEDDQVLKYVAPPFIVERETYYRVEHRDQARLIKEPPDYFTFHFDGKLHNWGMGFIGAPHTLRGVLLHVLGMKTFEFDGPDELLALKLPGDWVMRDGAEQPQLIEALAEIVNSTAERKIAIAQQELTREVIVASGTFDFHPLEGTYNTRWIHLFVDEKDSDEGSGGGSGSLEKFCTMLGSQVNMQVVNDIEGKQPLSISWGHHKSSYLSKLPTGEEKTQKVQKLLDVVAEQTNLKFSIEERPVQVWVISQKK